MAAEAEKTADEAEASVAKLTDDASEKSADTAADDDAVLSPGRLSDARLLRAGRSRSWLPEVHRAFAEFRPYSFMPSGGGIVSANVSAPQGNYSPAAQLDAPMTG